MRGYCFGLLVILTGLAVAGQLSAWAEGNPAADVPLNRPLNQPQDHTPRATIGFELYRDYLIVVQGSVGPLKGVNLLLDTGASPSVLDPRVAAKLHLQTAPAGVAVLDGSVQASRATLSTLQLGPLHKDNLPVLIEDLSFIQKWLPFQIDGIVGLDVLGQSAFVIDYPAREIRFGAAPSMPGAILLRMQDGSPIIDATVNRTPVRLLLDTGAPSLVLFEQNRKPGAAASPDIGRFDRKQTTQITLRLGEAEFASESAVVVHNQRDAGHDFDGLISPAAIGLTQIAFDPARGTVAFTRGAQAPAH